MCARPLEAEAPAVRQGQRHDADADVVRADALSIARSALAPEPGHLVVGRVAYRREVLMQRLLHRVADHLGRAAVVHAHAARAVRTRESHIGGAPRGIEDRRPIIPWLELIHALLLDGKSPRARARAVESDREAGRVRLPIVRNQLAGSINGRLAARPQGRVAEAVLVALRFQLVRDPFCFVSSETLALLMGLVMGLVLALRAASLAAHSIQARLRCKPPFFLAKLQAQAILQHFDTLNPSVCTRASSGTCRPCTS